jgi:hypothetical protein
MFGCLSQKLGKTTMVVAEDAVKNYAASYYGTEERHKDADFEHKLISQIMGADLEIAEFCDAEESREYSTMCSEIKTLLVDIKYRHKNWDLSTRDYKREARTTWIPLAACFVEYWKKTLSPTI